MTFLKKYFGFNLKMGKESIPKLRNLIWRKIQEIGLVTVYKEDKTIRNWLQKFKSLAFVPIDLVQTAFNFLISIEPVSPHIEIYFMLIFVQHGKMV